MARPWFSYKNFTPRKPGESRCQWHSRMRVSDLGWAIGGARFQNRIKRTGRHREGRGIVGYR